MRIDIKEYRFILRATIINDTVIMKTDHMLSTYLFKKYTAKRQE